MLRNHQALNLESVHRHSIVHSFHLQLVPIIFVKRHPSI
jgi:hypothetical protein